MTPFFLPNGLTNPSLLSSYLNSLSGVGGPTHTSAVVLTNPAMHFLPVLPSASHLQTSSSPWGLSPANIGSLSNVPLPLGSSSLQTSNCVLSSSIAAPTELTTSYVNSIISNNAGGRIDPGQLLMNARCLVLPCTVSSNSISNGITISRNMATVNSSTASLTSNNTMHRPTGNSSRNKTDSGAHVIIRKPILYTAKEQHCETSESESIQSNQESSVVSHKSTLSFSSSCPKVISSSNKEAVMNQALQELLATSEKDEQLQGKVSSPSRSTKGMASREHTKATSATHFHQKGTMERPIARIPSGWRRVIAHSTHSIVYISPSNDRFTQQESLKCYLQDVSSCKCGLPKDETVEEWLKRFCFDAAVTSTVFEDENVHPGLCDACLRRKGRTTPSSPVKSQYEEESRHSLLPAKRQKLESSVCATPPFVYPSGGDDMDICDDEPPEEVIQTNNVVTSQPSICMSNLNNLMKGGGNLFAISQASVYPIVSSHLTNNSVNLSNFYPSSSTSSASGILGSNYYPNMGYNPAVASAMSVLSPFSLTNSAGALTSLSTMNPSFLTTMPSFSVPQQNATFCMPQQAILNNPGMMTLNPSANLLSSNLLTSLIQQQQQQKNLQNFASLLHQQQQQQQLAQLTAALLSSSSYPSRVVSSTASTSPARTPTEMTQLSVSSSSSLNLSPISSSLSQGTSSVGTTIQTTHQSS